MRKSLFGMVVALASLTMPQVNGDCCFPQCCESLDGLYVGGNVGVFNHRAYHIDEDGFVLNGGTGVTSAKTRATAGAQVGYDLQWCSKLVGLVVDWNWVDGRHRRIQFNPSDTGNGIFVRDRFRWFTTIRGRAGLTFCNALIYATAGAAVARFKTTWRDEVFPFSVFIPNTFNHHRTRWGWAAGGGTEFLVGCGFSVGAEVLFMQFSDHRKKFTSRDTTTPGRIITLHFINSDQVWVARFLINYRLGNLFSSFGL